jgi:hypothetical protein
MAIFNACTIEVEVNGDDGWTLVTPLSKIHLSNEIRKTYNLLVKSEDIKIIDDVEQITELGLYTIMVPVVDMELPKAFKLHLKIWVVPVVKE